MPLLMSTLLLNKQHMFRISFPTILFTLTLASSPPPLQKCESTVGRVVNATVTGCKFRNKRYYLENGVKAGIEIYFELDKEVQDFKAVAKGKIGGMEIPYPLPNSDGCLNLKCPLKKGGPYFYQYTLSLPKGLQLPKMALNVKIELQDKNEDVIACIFIPVKIK